jgi:hypothetical protein
MLMGCSSKPNDAEAFQHIRNSENVAGETRVEKIVRKNGWPDGEDAYLVEYTYNLVADRSYDDLVFEMINEINKNPQKYFPPGFESIGINMLVIGALASTETSDGSFFRLMLQGSDEGQQLMDIGRRIREKELTPGLQTYLSQAQNDTFERNRNVLFAIAEIENKGLRPGIKAGDVYMNKVWKLAFRKTEQGWKLQ